MVLSAYGFGKEWSTAGFVGIVMLILDKALRAIVVLRRRYRVESW